MAEIGIIVFYILLLPVAACCGFLGYCAFDTRVDTGNNTDINEEPLSVL